MQIFEDNFVIINKSKLEDIIIKNKYQLIKSLNITNYEIIYKTILNFILDNLPLFIIFYLLFKYNNFKFKHNKCRLILTILLLILFYKIIQIIYHMNFQSSSILRAKNCLEATNKFIVNKTIKPIETKIHLLNKPFCEFFINTSHNTYIPCKQNFDIASCEAIKHTLAMGVRAIELDCFAKNNKGFKINDLIPIVAHGIEKKEGDIFTSTQLLFEDCINTIAEYGFLTSDPLIICLELNTNKLKKVQNKMKEIIIKKLGDKLLGKEYKLSTKNKKTFIHEPIKNLLNKVIFISGKGNTSELNDILDGHFDEKNLLDNFSHTDDKVNKLNTYGILKRIYPQGNLAGHLSYNYDPIPFWKKNYQMVALNFQHIDNNLIKNIAMFKNNSFIHFSELK